MARAVAAQAKENSVDRRRQYRKHLLVGPGVFFLGLIITLGTYSVAASSQGGGNYVITYGLLVGAALDFIYGLTGWIGELSSKK